MTERQLKDLAVDAVSLSDLILAQESLRVLDTGYQGLGIDTPEWITDLAYMVNREIVAKNEANLRKQLRLMEQRRAALATPAEQREQLDQSIANLKAKLGA